MHTLRRKLIIAFILGATVISFSQTIAEEIKVNQIGYLTSQVKQAYVSDESPLNLSTWRIKNTSTGAVVYESNDISTAIEDAATGEFVYDLKFDDFAEKGSFYIEVDGIGRSFNFEVSDMVYNDVFDVVMKGFYFQRSGVELQNPFAGKWSKPAEYADDAFIYEGYDGTNVIKGAKVDAAGGWRDAGDPNKKVVPASIAVYQLLTLYEYFPTYIKEAPGSIPSDPDISGLSAFLTEVKVSLDWLLKMQRNDGAVWHAVGQAEFFLDNMGHLDPNPRYLMPVSTTATADFAAVMATAYRVFKDIDSDYAETCLQSAEQAWLALNNENVWNNPIYPGDNGAPQYPEPEGYSSDPPGINNTAVYEDTEDSDERHWAAGELAISTDKLEYHEYFDAGIENGIWYPSLWPAVGNLANFSYAMAFRDKSNPTVNKLKNYITAYMDLYLGRIESTGFRTCLSPADYYWGSNSLAGQFAYTFLIAHHVLGDKKYEDASLSMLNYILGANSLNQTFISGMGDHPVENVFHLPSLLDGIDEVVPGLIPGGPNQYVVPSDVVHANYIQSQSPPPAKCYVDSEYSFASNEAVILESSVWAFVVGHFYYVEVDNDNDGFTAENDCDDSNASINPGKSEVPYNGIDDDCDPSTLDDDLDLDGFMMADDCNDNNAAVNSGASEVPYNGLDDDCDPSTLDDDLDQDGFVMADDCNDEDPAINPDAEEIVNNDIDEDCDGEDLTSSTAKDAAYAATIFPNPARNILYLNGNNRNLQYRILDINGSMRIEGITKNGGVDISSLTAGIYIVNIVDIQKEFNLKFIKI